MTARPFERVRRGEPRELNASRPKVAGLTDEMTRSSFSPECNWTVFGVDNWEQVLGSSQPDVLFVESAWQGNDGSWQYRIGSYDHEVSRGLPDLKRLVDWARSRDIPSVFWNKEDPVHFDLFAEAATLFDVVFTSDSNRIEAYKGLPNFSASVVSSLPFAAQPLIHNPVELYAERLPEACFAGTYYRTRHEARREQLEMLLDGARQVGLRIYDRMAKSELPDFAYPERFQPYVTGAVPYEEMVPLYRRFRVFLNTNSVSESPTMFSRRVFELLASGTPVISTPSVGMEEMFGDIVKVVQTSDEAAAAIEHLLSDEDYWKEVSTAGIRSVLRSHTYRHRLETICLAADVPFGPASRDDVAAIALEPTTRLMESLATQTQRPSEVVVDQNRAVADMDRWSNALGEIALVGAHPDLASQAAAASAAAVVILEGSKPPPQYLLEDLMLSRFFSPSTITGAARDASDERRQTNSLGRSAILIQRTVLGDTPWRHIDDVLTATGSMNYRGYGMRRDGEGWPTL